MNFFDFKKERNRILRNNPINIKMIIAENITKSPNEHNAKKILDKRESFFDNNKLKITNLIPPFDNFQNENKTHHTAIAKKRVLTDTDFNYRSNNFSEETNIYLQNKSNKKKYNCEKKNNNFNLSLINNLNISKTKEFDLNKNHLFYKSNINLDTNSKFDRKNQLFASVNFPNKRNFNKTNKNLNIDGNSHIRNIYSSHDNFLFSQYGNNNTLQVQKSSTGFLFNKSKVNNYKETIKEEKKCESYSVSITEPHKKNKTESDAKNKKINFNNTLKKTSSKVLNTDPNLNKHLLNKNNTESISINTLDFVFNGYEKAKAAKKQISTLIRSYAANTYKGLVR
jgi:hypothetical protein